MDPAGGFAPDFEAGSRSSGSSSSSNEQSTKLVRFLALVGVFGAFLFFCVAVAGWTLYALSGGQNQRVLDKPHTHNQVCSPAAENIVPEAFGRRLYTQRLGASVRDLIESFRDNASLSKRLVHPYERMNEMAASGTSLYDKNHTNLTFCGILAWCTSWGVTQCEMDYHQKVLLNRALVDAMSPSGYQTLVGIANRQRIIGELESSIPEACQAGVIKTFEAWEHLTEFLPDDASVYDAAQKVGVNLTNCTLLPLAGARPGLTNLQEVGSMRFKSAVVDWLWRSPPLFHKRLAQFCRYSIAIFVEDPANFNLDGSFALWFEGHHLSVRLDVRVQPDGTRRVHSTPLFLGAFPMLGPQIFDTTVSEFKGQSHRGYELQAKWTEAQSLMLDAVLHLRQFWSLLPPDVRDAAFIPPTYFTQQPPFHQQMPNEFQFLAGLHTHGSPSQVYAALEGLPYANVSVGRLSDEAKWQLAKGLEIYLGTLAEEVAPDYLAEIVATLTDASAILTVSRAGGDISNEFSRFMSFIKCGNLVHELYQTDEWSLQSKENWANHVHSVFRDMSYDWASAIFTNGEEGTEAENDVKRGFIDPLHSHLVEHHGGDEHDDLGDGHSHR